MDRNQRVRLMHAVETYERQTKRYRCPNGALGRPAVAILRTLLFRYANVRTGLCCPSYDALQRVTGLCRQSIANGLKALEAARVLVVKRGRRRLWYGRGGSVVVQALNQYAFLEFSPKHLPDVSLNFPKNPRVHAADQNQNRQIKGSLWWLGKGVCDGDWRQRARALSDKLIA